MKKLIIILFLQITIHGNAQNPILNIHTSDFAEIENAYYKDVDGFYNQFVGTWVYTDVNKTIRFKFIKKEMFYYQSIVNCYVDFLIGEIEYIENGNVIINSLMNIDANYNIISQYNISSIGKVGYNWAPFCMECSNDVERLSMIYNEPSNDDVGLSASFIMRRVDENGVQKIKIQYMIENNPMGLQSDFETPSTTTNFTIPYGDYILIREN